MLPGTSLRRLAPIAVLSLVAGGCGGGNDSGTSPGGPTKGLTQAAVPRGVPLDKAGIAELAKLFPDQPLQGGQSAPRLYRWVNDDVAAFVQFDHPDPAQATALRYIGVSVKGVFCAEAQPGGPRGGFTHFHRLSAPEYRTGHGGKPGEPGYWLEWMAVDTFDARDGRHVTPGVDYAFSPTPAPNCGGKLPKPAFAGPGAGDLSKAELSELAVSFGDQLLTGGQRAPRFYRWVNEEAAIFVQFDKPDPAERTSLRYIGLSLTGEFCDRNRPHRDFTHFHRVNAPEYSQGHGGPPGTKGYWLSWLALDTFDTGDGRHVTPGVDREFSPTPAPRC